MIYRREKFLFVVFFAITVLGTCHGCATFSRSRKVDLHWEFREKFGMPVRACLLEEDVIKLRDALLSCGMEEE